jgi:tRNA(fMet)-specific endonuclease VapC
MYILDTDMLSRLHGGDSRIQEKKDRFDPSQVVTTAITRIEILQGRFDYVLKAVDGDDVRRAFAWLQRSEELLGRITIVAVDGAVAGEFDRLRQNKKLKKIGRADLLIASIALANRATVVTRNLRHFRQLPGLELENWAD